MKRRSKLAKQLEAISPKLWEVEPGFRVPESKTDAEEVAWLDQNHERLAELTLKHGGDECGARKRHRLVLEIRMRREGSLYAIRRMCNKAVRIHEQWSAYSAPVACRATC